MRILLLCCAAALLAGCGEKASTSDDLNTIDLTLPDGNVIRVETMIDPKDLVRGMMFRTAMQPGHGMLFFYREPGKYGEWMYQKLIPLDMIWLDSNRQIVEIVPDAPPCKTQASKCPVYGGNQTAKYRLELAGGMARKYGLQVGQTVRF